MEWFTVSVITTIVISGAPLFFAEVWARFVYDAELRRYHRQLRFATVAVWAAFALWFWLDYRAVAAGQRPFAVAVVNILAFIILFLALAVRVLSLSRRHYAKLHSDGQTTDYLPVRKPLVEYLSSKTLLAVYVFVAISLISVLAVWLTSTNSIGYRAKGMLLFIAGAAFFYLSLYRWQLTETNQTEDARSDSIAAHRRTSKSLLVALAYYCAFEVSAILTLTLNWNIPTQYWVGVSSQLAVGVLGLFGCAKMLARE